MKSSYVAVGVIGLAVGGLWYAAGGTRPPAAHAAETLRAAPPLSHDNLTVYFVHGPDSVDDSRVVTLQEALERKWAVVHETGSVNELVVENLSPDHDLFVQSGDIIKGGRQDRMIASDMLLPPGSGRMPVASHCVEQSRWSGRGGEAATHFAVSDSFAVGNSIKVANANRDQGEVWKNVKVQQDNLSKNVGVQVNAVASPTSLQLALENPAVRAKVDEYRAALAAAGDERPGVVGAVFVVNGVVSSAEVYGSNGLFRKAWPKLLKSAAEEALAEKTAARTPAPPTAREVEQFLANGAKPFDSAVAQINANEEIVQTESAAQEEPGRARTRLSPRSGTTRPVMVNASGGGGFSEQIMNEATTTSVNPDRVGRVIVEGGNVTGNRVIQNQVEYTRSNLQTLNRALPPETPNAEIDNQNQWGTPPQIQTILANQRPIRGYTPIQAATPANPGANQVNTSRVETASALMLESRDSGKKVIHRSYIKK